LNLKQIRYIIDESMLMLKRRRGANIISIIIMGLSLLILVIFLLVTINIAGVISQASEELRVYVYLDDGVPKGISRDIQFRLLGMKGVEEVIYISRQEALSSFSQTLGEDSDILEALEKNPLPDAYRVKVKSDYIKGEFFEGVAQQVEEWEGVEEVRYGRRWFERGEKLVKGFYLTDLFLGLIIFLSGVFVISNTVRLTILHRQRAIDVMKLVGATNAYIQVPFVIEGALQGIVASLLATGLLAVLYVFTSRYIAGISFLRIEAILVFVTFCALLGALGSYTAMRRFLKI